MRYRQFTAIALTVLAIAQVAARAPAGPKSAIARTLTHQLKDDFTRHTQVEIVAAIKPVDINGDSIQDWQVDFDAFGSAWCGTGGCRYQLWLGRRNAAPLLVFDRQMRELKIVQRGKRNVFVFDFHGTECGGFGAQACPGEFAWSQAHGRMILLPTPRKHTSTANPIVAF